MQRASEMDPAQAEAELRARDSASDPARFFDDGDDFWCPTDDPAWAPSAEQSAQWLQEHLGPKVTAFLIGSPDPESINRYARDVEQPTEPTSSRLQVTYAAARILADAFGDHTALAWFFGTNGIFEDRAPGSVIRETEDSDRLAAVVDAARHFASGGFS